MPKERKDKLSKAKSENNALSKAEAAAAYAEGGATRRALEVAVAPGDQAAIPQAQAALKDAQSKTIVLQNKKNRAVYSVSIQQREHQMTLGD